MYCKWYSPGNGRSRVNIVTTMIVFLLRLLLHSSKTIILCIHKCGHTHGDATVHVWIYPRCYTIPRWARYVIDEHKVDLPFLQPWLGEQQRHKQWDPSTSGQNLVQIKMAILNGPSHEVSTYSIPSLAPHPYSLLTLTYSTPSLTSHIVWDPVLNLDMHKEHRERQWCIVLITQWNMTKSWTNSIQW